MSALMTLWLHGNPDELERLAGADPGVNFWRELETHDAVGWGAED